MQCFAMIMYIYSLPHGKRKGVAYENKAERNLSEKLQLRRSAKRSEVSSSSLLPSKRHDKLQSIHCTYKYVLKLLLIQGTSGMNIAEIFIMCLKTYATPAVLHIK